MKQWMKLIVMVLALAMLLGAANAALAEKQGDFTYKIENGKAVITDYTGNATELTIPTRLGGKPVAAIGYMAFYNCRSLTAVTIRGTVTSIDKMAFYGCTNLRTITLSNSVTSIGVDAFAYCTSLATVTIPDSVTSIGGGAFHGCTSLYTVITNSRGAKHYSWGSDVMVGLFEGDFCYQISNDNAIICGYTGFSARVVIPAKLGGKPVTSIGSSAFSNNATITSISIPDSVTSIGDRAFISCSRLTTINIPSSVTSIDIYAFSNCSRLTAITLPNSLTSIRSYMFSGCTSLTAITIPDSVTSIGGSAFYGCTSLTTISIPDSVTYIGKEAFKGCTNLTTVNTSCSAAQSYSWPAGVRVGLWDGDFSFVAAGDTAYCLMGYSGNASVVIVPSTYNGKPITAINNSTFDPSVTLFVTGETPYVSANPCWRYTVNADGTFCLTGTNITNTRLILPAEACGTAITAIGDYAFANMNMSFVHIPDSIVAVGANPFGGCTNLATIVVNPENAGLHVSEDGMLYSKADKRLVCAPAGVTWGRMRIPDGVRSIGPYALYNVQATEIVLPDSLTGIGAYAFAGNKRLTAIELPDGVAEIPEGTFSGCTKLESIAFPKALTGIGTKAFADCGALRSPNFPATLTTIGEQAFTGCDALAYLTFPASLTTMGERAFYDCDALQQVTIKGGTQTIGARAFADCGDLRTVTLPTSVTSIGANAFDGAPLLTLMVQPGSHGATYARENLLHALYPDSDSWLAE